VLILFFVTVIASRWFIALSQKTDNNTEIAMSAAALSENNAAVSSDNADQIEELKASSPSPSATTEHRKTVQHVRRRVVVKQKSWFERLFNP
jgi:hypothetical protein